MKKDTFIKALNITAITILSIVVVTMLSSFLLRVSTPPVDSHISLETAKINPQDVIQVNVLNACGVTGLASQAKEYLRNRGFDVVEVGNYSEKVEKSQILDRLGDPESAKKVAFAVGISDSCITQQIDSALFLRSTIIIGKDFASLKPFK